MNKKRLTIALFAALLPLVLIASWATPSRGDVIPEDEHWVTRYVRVTNVDDFADVVLVSYTVGPMVDGYRVALVEQDVALDKGYKFNDLRLFAIQKSALDAAGGLQSIDFATLVETVPPAEIVGPGGYTVIDENPLVEAHYDYRIESTGESAVSLVLEKRVLKYDDGTADEVEEF